MRSNNFTNSFSKGWNSDIDPRLQEPSTYRDPKNISLTSDSDFYTAKNIRGSKEVEEILSNAVNISEVNVLGAFECTGTYSSYGADKEKNPSILIFLQKSSIQTFLVVEDFIFLFLPISLE